MYSHNRLTKILHPPFPSNSTTYWYGDRTEGSNAGCVTKIKDGSGVQNISYGNMGEVVIIIRTFALPYDDRTYTFDMEFSYDSWNRMQSISYPDGEVVQYHYNSGGDLESMDGNKNSTIYHYIDDITYNRFGKRESVSYGNGTETHYKYDDLLCLEQLVSYDAQSNVMQYIHYNFDHASNILNISNIGATISGMGGNYTMDYTYDGLDRLVESNSTNGSYGSSTLSMTYSPDGRIGSKIQTATSTSSFSEPLNQDCLFGYYANGDQPHAVRRIVNAACRKTYDLKWDLNGNLAQVDCYRNHNSYYNSRFLFWNENNNLTAVIDDQYFSYYGYDHEGERTLKLMGRNSVMDINAHAQVNQARLDNVTLYTSPYLVATNQGYTKHYYAGAERVAARIGSGNLDALWNTIDNNDDLLKNAEIAFEQGIEQTDGRFLPENDNACIMDNEYAQDEFDYWIDGIPSQIRTKIEISIEQFKLVLFKWADGCSQDESDVYFYHSDHLGSASWITDNHGDAVQHIQYLPYGEPYINQRLSGYNERFTFTGKELDEETGYGYFGARYMDHELMMGWLSVDPMADKYPSLSPYNYCAWNPMRLVDPDGKEIDVSALYKKGRDGAYKYEYAVKSFEFFANTKIGRKELAKYAKSGQTIAGHTFTEDGKYHSKGIDLSFDCGKITNAGADGETGRILKNGRLKINITLSNVCNDGGGCVLETICHEVLMHAYHGSVDFADDGKLNNSDFSSRLRDYAKDGGMRQNYAEESKYSYRMKNFAVPILLDFFAGKKTRTDIIKLINSGIKYSKIK